MDVMDIGEQGMYGVREREGVIPTRSLHTGQVGYETPRCKLSCDIWEASVKVRTS